MSFKRLAFRFFIVCLILVVTNLQSIARSFFPLKYSDYIYKYAVEYNLDPYLVVAVIKAESNFNERAKSDKNAFGLMQITHSTGEWAAGEMNLDSYNVDLLCDPEYNIRMGCWYLDNLKKEFVGDMDLVLAAYNGGRGNVQKWLNNSDHSKNGKNLDYIPFKETDKYIKRVKVNYNIYKFLYSSLK